MTDNPVAGGDSLGRLSRTRALVLLALIVAAAAFFRLNGLDDRSLWVDEGFTAWLTARPVAVYFEELKTDTGGPLYYFYSRPFILAGPRSHFTLRLPAAIAGTLSVILIYLLATELSRRRWVGLAAALALAVNDFHVYYSHDARNYMLYFFMALTAMVCLSRLARPGAHRRGHRIAAWIGFVLSGAGMIYTHNVGFVFLAMFCAYYPLACWLSGSTRGRHWLRPVGAVALAGVAIAVLYLPWLEVLRAQLGHVMDSYWIAKPTPGSVAISIGGMIWMGVPALLEQDFGVPGGLIWAVAMVLMALWLAAAVIGWIGWIAWGRRRGGDRRALALLLALLAGMAAVIAISVIRRPVYMHKSVIPVLAVLLLGPAGLLLEPRRWLPRKAAIGLLAGLLGLATLYQIASHSLHRNEQWREGTQFVLARAQPQRGDLILVDEAFHAQTVEWYLPGSAYEPIRWESGLPMLLAPGGSVQSDEKPKGPQALARAIAAAVDRRLAEGATLWVIERSYHGLNDETEAALGGLVELDGREEFDKVRIRWFSRRAAAPAVD